MLADAKLAGLRRRIERLETLGTSMGASFAEGRPNQGRAVLSFGHPDLDASFSGGGLGVGSHQVAGAPGDQAASRAFGFMLLARYLAERPNARALLVQEAAAFREAGSVYGPGLHALGLDPGRLVFVHTQDGGEALRAINEALRARAPEVLLVDLWQGAALADLSVTRRFNLAAVKAQALVLLVTPDLRATSAALTRWTVASAPSSGLRRRLGAPAFSLDLVRNRHGRTGRWTLEWNSHDLAFQSISKEAVGPGRLPTSPVAAFVAASAVDRSGHALEPAAVLPFGAYRQAG